MPAIEELVEPQSLAQAAKLFFQKPEPPREITHEPKPSAKEPAKEPVAEPVKEPAKAREPAPKEEPSKATPQSEEDTVFGTPPAKPAKADPTPDADFEAKLSEETKGMTDKAAKKWAELRHSEKAAKDEARQARDEAKAAAEARQNAKASDDAPKITALTEENAALKLQLAEAEKTLSVTHVERSQKYRREVGEPLNDLTKQAEEMAARYDVSSKDILSALNADPKERADQLAELAADFKEADRIDLYSIAKDMDRLNRKAETLREKAKTDLSSIEQEDREADERTAAEMRAAYGTATKRAWDEAASTLDFLRPNAAAPEWTAALANASAASTTYVPGQDPIADGRIVAQANQLPFVLKALDNRNKRLEAMTTERDQLLARIEAENAHDPGLSSARDEDATGQDETGEELSIGQRAKMAAAKLGR